ncbi:MAG TPA: hypothetical protein VGR92_03210 [Steroidobacteraceae bacterium]|nr:hypothetical protein [Steroidobacteraceae bacterium]
MTDLRPALATVVRLIAVPAFLVSALVAQTANAAGQPAAIVLASPSGLALRMDLQDGSYTVTDKGKSWLGKGIVSVLVGTHWYRSAAVRWPETDSYGQQPAKLILTGDSRKAGADRLGAYEEVDLTWSVPRSGIRLITSFRLYQSKPYVVFTQTLPDGFKHYATGKWTVPRVVFPQFLPWMGDARQDLYSWVSGGLDTQRFSYGPAGSLGGTVDVLLLSDQSLDAMVLSPFSNYLVATQQSRPVATETETDQAKATIDCGIEGLIPELPAGFTQSNILVAGAGITDTLRAWGHVLLQGAGKPVPSKYTGATMKYPTYWDDYGSYYREHGFKETGFKTYEDIILGVARDAKAHGLRIGAYEIDDSDQMLFTKGLFEPRPDLFPHGLRWLHQQLGAPLEAYTSWVAPGGPYRRKYEYYAAGTGNLFGWPEGTMGDVFYGKRYWHDTAEKLSSWGAALLQQDYLSNYDGNPVMMGGLDRMERYLQNEASALAEKGIFMQYCMTLPRNIMQSTENPIVISLQGGSDHHVYMAEPQPVHRDDDPYNWKQMMFGSALYSAVGLWPSRDNIQTVADPNALENLLFANLLGGEIQLGHRIGEANFALIAKTYREGDGLILKPDRPIVPLDSCYESGCAVGDTFSQHGDKKWFYILSFPPAGPVPTMTMEDLGTSGNWYLYDYDLGVGKVVSASAPIPLRKEGKHQYLIAAALFGNGMTVLGDCSKFVTMADERVPAVRLAGSSLMISIESDSAKSPIITGYSKTLPSIVRADHGSLGEVSSLSRLRSLPSGWFWDPETGLWYVKVDFSGAKDMTTKTFTIG